MTSIGNGPDHCNVARWMFEPETELPLRNSPCALISHPIDLCIVMPIYLSFDPISIDHPDFHSEIAILYKEPNGASWKRIILAIEISFTNDSPADYGTSESISSLLVLLSFAS